MKIDRSKFLALCLAMVPVVALACGGSGDGTGSGGSDLSSPGGGGAKAPTTKPVEAGAPPAAADVVTVNTNPVKVQTEGCTVDISAPVVSIPTNKAAETAINAALKPLSDSPCSEGNVTINSSFEVTANANGLLSILVTGSEFFQGTAHPSATVATFNFDVKNGGKQLSLTNVLTADGIAKELATCLTLDPAAAREGLPDPATEGGLAQEDCKFAVTPDPTDGFEPTWVVRPTGLEIEAGTDHADGDFFSSLVAWKDLKPSGVTPGTVVADFANAQK